MQDLHSRTLISVGKCSDGLYYMELTLGKRIYMAALVNAEVWHLRLGHAPESKIREVNFLGNSVISLSNKNGDSCIRTKQTRLPFLVAQLNQMNVLIYYIVIFRGVIEFHHLMEHYIFCLLWMILAEEFGYI